METFIYKDLKKASLNKVITKVKTLGPYSYALSMILELSFIKKIENDLELLKKYLNKPVFRGILINKEDFDE